jgi:hypothetical protein
MCPLRVIAKPLKRAHDKDSGRGATGKKKKDHTGSMNHLPYYSVGTETVAPAVKRPERETDHLPPFMPSWLREDIHTHCITGTLARYFLIFDPMF